VPAQGRTARSAILSLTFYTHIGGDRRAADDAWRQRRGPPAAVRTDL